MCTDEMIVAICSPVSSGKRAARSSAESSGIEIPERSRSERSIEGIEMLETSMSERSRPERSTLMAEVSKVNAEESADESMVTSELRSRVVSPASFASSSKVLPVKTSTSGFAIWSWTICELVAASMSWPVRAGV